MILAESGFSSKIHQKSAKVPFELTLRLRDLFFRIRGLILHKDELSYLYAMLCHDFGWICLFSLKKLAKNQSKLPFVLTFRLWDHNFWISRLILLENVYFHALRTIFRLFISINIKESNFYPNLTL